MAMFNIVLNIANSAKGKTMKWLIFTYKNIVYSLKHKPAFCAIMLIVQFVSALAIFLSIGIVQNAYSKQQTITEQNQRFVVDLRFYSSDETVLVPNGYIVDEYGNEEIQYSEKRKIIYDNCVLYGEFCDKIDQLCKEIDYQYNYIGFDCYTDSSLPEESYRVVSMMYSPLVSEKNEPKENNIWVEYNKYPYELGDHINIDGKEFVVEKNDKDSSGAWGYAYIKMNSKMISDDYLVISFELMLDYVPSEKEVNEIKGIINSLFRVSEISEPVIPDLMELQYQRTTVLVGIVIMILCAVNAGSFYLYLLYSRKKNLSVLRICGCKTWQAAIIYYSELFVQITLPFSAATLCFDKWICPMVSSIYPIFNMIYNLKIYLILYITYTILSFLIMLPRMLPLLRDTEFISNKDVR